MDATESGPVDIVMLRFTGNKFNGEIAPALRDLVVRGLVRVIDLLFVYKEANGTVGRSNSVISGPNSSRPLSIWTVSSAVACSMLGMSRRSRPG
jgi:hypothetical protein